MNRSTVRALQQILSEAGHYDGEVDGLRGPRTDAAVTAFLDARPEATTSAPAGWGAKRRAIAALQLACTEREIDAGPADGLWGPRTDAAVEALVESLATGRPPSLWRDLPPSDANPHGWPRETEAELRAFFGAPCEVPLVRVTCPWRLALDWDRRSTTGSISCHRDVAESLERVLNRVHEHYGDERIRDLDLHLYGGSYNCRRMRRGSSWSTHAWGIAIDWMPSSNKLDWGRDRAVLAGPDYDAWWDIWEAEGWLSLGRHRNFDWMHVQAARL